MIGGCERSPGEARAAILRAQHLEAVADRGVVEAAQPLGIGAAEG